MSVVALGAVVGYVFVSYIQAARAWSDADKIAVLLPGNPEVAAWIGQNLTGSAVVDIKAIRLQFGVSCAKSNPVGQILESNLYPDTLNLFQKIQ